MANYTCVAFIPARSGSKRIPDKNIKLLAGHPLIAYSIYAARTCGVFKHVVVSTDSDKIASIAQSYKAEILIRPKEMATDISPDIEWVKHALQQYPQHDCFSILRPTSPFRTSQTIRRAWHTWYTSKPLDYDSLRAVELCSQHPGKMWRIESNRLVPILTQPKPVPWHSQQYASLPEVYAQNASLEIAWIKTAIEQNSISGENIMPFITEGYEGFDLNTELDWTLAVQLFKNGDVALPSVLSVNKSHSIKL